MSIVADDRWRAADAYEAYMGRWSRPLAQAFLEWLQPPASAQWLEIGCGTGALTSTILEHARPTSIVACDPSPAFVEHARAQIADPRVSFVVAAAGERPDAPATFDIAVTALVLNFLPDPAAVLDSIRRQLRSSGTFGAYVWDYADGMELLRIFWDEVVALDPGATSLDEGARFPLCRRDALAAIVRDSGFTTVETTSIEIATNFAGFDDYWTPFLRGTGPAPAYVASLDDEQRDRLRHRLEGRLVPDDAGRIRLRARAWAVRGVTG